jgi:hypothetical protein
MGSICIQTKRTEAAVLKGVTILRSERTLGRYVADGGKYCLLAGGGEQSSQTQERISLFPGSLFLLALVAVAKLKARVRDADLTPEVVLRINHLLRAPAMSTLMLLFLINYLDSLPCQIHIWEILL